MAVVTATVVGIAATTASTAMSFKQAADAKRLQAEADAEARKAMKDAKDRAQVDYYEGLGIPLDAYEAEFENQLAGQKQAVEALAEGDARQLAAGVGRIGAQQTAAGEQTRIAQAEEMFELDKMKVESKDAINQQLIEMDVAQAREQNQRSRDAQMARSQAIQQGISGIGSLVGQVGSAAPLFSQSGSTRRGAKLAKTYGDGAQGTLKDAEYQGKLADLGISKEEYRQVKNNKTAFNKLLQDKGWDWGGYGVSKDYYDYE